MSSKTNSAKPRDSRSAYGRLLLAALIAAAAGFAAASPARADDVLASIKQRGTLRAGVAVYTPFLTRKPDGSWEGYEIDLLDKLAQELHVKVELVDGGWDTIVEGIVTGKYDVVPGICVTPKRAEVIDFSNSHNTTGGALAFLPGNPKIKAVADADKPDVIIADVAGSWNEEVSKKAFPHATHKAFAQIAQLDTIQEITSGRADAAVFDEPVGTKEVIEHYGSSAIRFLPSATTPLNVMPCELAYAFKKGDVGMLNYLNKFFAEQKQSGELDALSKKWLSAN
jgi:ABC-type amino acid transport substrate-binding protein